MPDSLQGLAVFVLGLLPGAIYVWAFEREVGSWGPGAADRVFRFIGVSALFQILFFPLFFWVWASKFRALTELPWQEGLHEVIVVSGAWWIFLISLVYLGLPLGVGVLAATAVTRARRRTSGLWPVLARVLAGRDPAPLAWDYLFSARSSGLIRLELTTGERIGGIFSSGSYASGYPEKPQDVYLERGLLVDPETGQFSRDKDGNYKDLGAGILVRWDNVKVLEFFDGQAEEEDEKG